MRCPGVVPLIASAILAIVGCSSPAASTATQTSATVAPIAAGANAMVNEDVMKMAKGGLSDDVIIAAIHKADKTAFDTSATGLVALKNAGVSDAVLRVVLDPTAKTAKSTARVPVAKSGTPPSGPASPPPPKAPDPATKQPNRGSFVQSSPNLSGVQEAGIYFGHGNRLEQLEPTVYSGGATGNKFLHNFVTPLVSQDTKATVRSVAANQRIHGGMPTFYFFFESTGAGLSNTAGTFVGYMNSASSPNEFVLVRMKVNKDQREIIVGKNSTIRESNGVSSKDTVDFAFTKLRPGVYEVKPKAPLMPGEYCFFYQGGAANQGGVGKLFDFGVDADAVSQ